MCQPHSSGGLYSPLVAPERTLAEITIKGLILGIVLSMLLAGDDEGLERI